MNWKLQNVNWVRNAVITILEGMGIQRDTFQSGTTFEQSSLLSERCVCETTMPDDYSLTHTHTYTHTRTHTDTHTHSHTHIHTLTHTHTHTLTHSHRHTNYCTSTEKKTANFVTQNVTKENQLHSCYGLDRSLGKTLRSQEHQRLRGGINGGLEIISYALRTTSFYKNRPKLETKSI